jgi:sporulation protein YlmC with PRC-barrel domain
MKTATMLASGALMLAVGAANLAAQTPGQTGTTQTPPAQGKAPDKAMPGAMQHAMPMAPARASEIIGMNIEDGTGKDIAEIKDLVVCEDGVLAVVEVSGKGDNPMVGVPLNQLQVRLDESQREAKAKDKDVPAAAGSETPDIEKFSLKGDRTLLDGAPVLKDIKTLDGTWVRNSVDHYSGKAKKPMTKEEGAGDKTAMATKPTCVKHLIGEDVKGTDGDGIGDVKDVAIDLRNSQVAYAIVSTGGVLGMGNAMHAIPFDRLTINEDSVTVPMTKEGVEKLPNLDLDRLPANPSTDLGAVHDADHDKHVKSDNDHRDG